jgi:serine phosphatase RsbU (regulator of sigma subunit)
MRCKNPIILMLLLTCFLYDKVFSQQDRIDSLKKDIAQSKNDTANLYSLNRLIEISPDGDWQKANEEFGKIAKKIIDRKAADPRSIHVAKRFYSAYINNIGYDEFEKGNVSKAIECYHQSMKLYEDIGEIYDVALACNNLGYMYYSENDYETALEYYLKSLEIYKKIDLKWGIALCYNNIGLIYFTRLKAGVGNVELTDSVEYNFYKTLGYFTNANIIQEKGSDIYAYANSTNNLGTLFCLKADHYLSSNKKKDSVSFFLEKSISYHEKALKLFTEFGNNGGIVDAESNMGYAYYLKKDFSKALMYCHDALKIAKENKLPQKISLAAKHLYRIYSSANNTKDALAMYVLHIQMRDSVSNEKNRKSLIQKSFQYEYDKKTLADSIKVAEEKKVTLAQLKQEQTFRYALYAGLSLVLIFSIFLFNRFKVTQKQKKIIEIKEQETQKQNVIIKQQKHLVEEHQKETIDSINYAKRIQYALLANSGLLKEHLKEHFVLFKPKDIVSGDFYWATHQDTKFYLAVCDSTGHGVPGAFMSLLNMGFLSEAIKEKNIFEPHEVLNYVRQRLIESIGNDGQQDGMDCILLCIDAREPNQIRYAAANNEPILIRDNEIIGLPKDKMPVGKGERMNSFTLQTAALQPGDTLYLYTDGYADQFGGPKGKKFKYKQLNELLLAYSEKNVDEQSESLMKTFDAWKGNLEQVDDVCVVGIKF